MLCERPRERERHEGDYFGTWRERNLGERFWRKLAGRGKKLEAVPAAERERKRIDDMEEI